MAQTGTQLYEELMRFRPDGLSANAWAVKAGVSRTIWQDLRRHGNPSRRTLEKLLDAAGSSLAEFEALRIRPEAPGKSEDSTGRVADAGRNYRGAEMRHIPLILCNAAGEWAAGISQIEIEPSIVLDRLPRPVSLFDDPEAYALTVPDNAMWPRFRPGRHLIVSPTAPVGPGDDVLVKLAQVGANSPFALLKQLEQRLANVLLLRQFTPDMTFEIPLAQVATVHKVIGESI